MAPITTRGHNYLRPYLYIWQGSDYNPRRGPNDAEGGPPDNADRDAGRNSRADRSNLVETTILDHNVPRLPSGAAMVH